MDFREYLKEGRDAPLFHGTSLVQAYDILRFDEFIGNTEEFMTLVDIKNKDNYSGYKEVKGVSLTRDYQIAAYFGKRGIVFELDQRALSNNYKIVPHNHWSAGVLQYAHQRTARTSFNPSDVTDNEAEEFLIGSIKNAHKYIVRIIVTDDINMRKLQSTHYDALKQHPKLVYKGHFLNA